MPVESFNASVYLLDRQVEAGRGGHATVVDMTGTRFCDSAGVRVLVRAHEQALAKGGELVLVIPASAVLRVFALTGIARVIPHFADLNQALQQAHVVLPAS